MTLYSRYLAQSEPPPTAIPIAINTGSLSSDTRAAVAQAKGLGFTAVEVNLQQQELRYDYGRQPDLDFYEGLAQEIHLRRMTVVSVHNLFLSGAQVFSQGARRDILRVAARVTARLGAAMLVVHPEDLFVSEEALSEVLSRGSPGREELPLIQGFDELQAEMNELRVGLALENVNHWRDTLLTNQAEHMHLLTGALECRVTLDVRRSLNRPSLQRWVELVGQRIGLLHLHDRIDGQEHHPPLDPAWQDHSVVLKGTTAQACVIEASATPTAHGNIRASRDHIAGLWSES